MMKDIIITSAFVLVSAMAAGEANAACPTSGQVTDVAGTKETFTITFGTLSGNNKFVTVGGSTLTKVGGGTIFANELATFFSTGTVPSGSTASGSLPANWTAGPVTGGGNNTVVFTYSTPGNVANLTAASNDNNALGTSKTTDGSAAGVALSTLLVGNTVCVGTPPGNWQAQEFHKSGGDLIDWKKGANDPIDKTASVGSWTITGNDSATRVNYTYGSTTYNDAVYDMGGGSYAFCDQNGNVTTAIYIKPGQVGC